MHSRSASATGSLVACANPFVEPFEYAPLTGAHGSTLFLRAVAQLTPSNLAPVSVSGALSAIKYTGIGGTGQYNQVTDLIPGQWPSCTANPSCVTSPKTVSGASNCP